jgi:hypothetical protein
MRAWVYCGECGKCSCVGGVDCAVFFLMREMNGCIAKWDCYG